MMHRPAEDGVGSFFKGSYTMLTGNRLYILLLFVPIAMVSEEFFESEAIIFSLCCFAILPLAALLGDATEQTALHTSQTIGGLLNATFGNATEMIICFFLLKAGQLEVVKLSLLGSILSNALLVLGFACLASGSVKRNVTYGSTTATANTTMLQVSVIGVILPTLMTATGQFESHGNESLSISRFISVIFLFLYVLFLINTLCPCPALKPGEEEDEKEAEEGEEEVSYLGFWSSILWLLGATLVLAYLSELLSGAVEGAAEGMGLTPAFVGFVIIPIIGNAAEHSTAVVMAFRLKMDLALAVAQGSSTQIALFVVPVMVLLGWLIGQPLDLDFGLFESAVSTCGKYLGSALRVSLSTFDSHWLRDLGRLLIPTDCVTSDDLCFPLMDLVLLEQITFLSTVIVASVINDGSTNWLEGAMLISTYIIISSAFFFFEFEGEDHGRDDRALSMLAPKVL